MKLTENIQKELRTLNEQKTGTPPGQQFTSELCWCNPDYPVNVGGYPYAGVDCDWNTPIGQTMSSSYLTIGFQTPVVGDEYMSSCPGINANGGTMSSFPTWLCTWKVTSLGLLGPAPSGYGTGNRDVGNCAGPGGDKDEYHMWTECSDFTGTGGSESMTWSGLPGYVSGADPNNSQLFYDWIDTAIGGISVGDVIKIDLTATQTYTLCLQYDGVTTNVTPVTPWNSPLSIVSSHPDCDDCVNGSTENFACMGGIIPGPGTCMGPGNYSMGQTYVQAVYPTMADCQADPKCGSTQDERGCLDINALNYNECCDMTDPNCIVTIPDPECCRYEHEPDPCKTNPKECWFCKGAGVPCIQFSQTSAAWTAAYTGIKYPTQADCMTNSDCGERGGEKTKCHCCNKFGQPVMPTNLNYTDCTTLDGTLNPSMGMSGCKPVNQPLNCKKPLPTLEPGLFEEVKRYKQLL
tara:strand:- start:1636 stop:3021 length:1386 start_codon:yes stop_codon:yes gene_type:complete